MQLSTEQISQFRLLYKKEFGEDISQEEATEQGIKLVQLVQLIYKPMSKHELIRVQKEINIIRERINKRNKYGKVNVLT